MFVIISCFPTTC